VVGRARRRAGLAASGSFVDAEGTWVPENSGGLGLVGREGFAVGSWGRTAWAVAGDIGVGVGVGGV
jgi:hypothetical protein